MLHIPARVRSAVTARPRGLRASPVAAATLASLLTAAIVGGVTHAFATASTTINGCENVAFGTIRLLPSNNLPAPYNTSCNTTAKDPLLKEVPISWNQIGPAGPAGQAGAAGAQGQPGPKGDAGPAGLPGAAGAQGAQGPKGDAGAPGVQGAQGPQGPAGLTWQGAWSSSTTYNVNDAVQFQGSAYIALKANSNDQPTDTGTWGLLAAQGLQGIAGQQGAQGQTGSPGPQGPPGASVVSLASLSGIPCSNGGQPGSLQVNVDTASGGTVQLTCVPVTLFPLTVGEPGNGSGTVTSDRGGINCGTTCSATLGSGTVVTLTASPASGSRFAGWGGACSGTGACTITMSAATQVTASFIGQVTLRVNVSGFFSAGSCVLGICTADFFYTGTVSSPGIISCSVPATPSPFNSCNAVVDLGSSLALTASPSGGSPSHSSVLTGWSGCDSTDTATPPNCLITMSSSRLVSASFNAS
jgi:hypothetical protein